MSVPPASTSSPLTVSGIATPESSDANRQVYQRLKLAFALGLRRQLFLAVCDDTVRSNVLAAQLQTELNQQALLQSLQLDLANPNPLTQIRGVLVSSGDSLTPRVRSQPRGLQLLGISALTRGSATSQWAFLKHLREIPAAIASLDVSLIFWISRPWLHVIQQSAPEFWQHCTGVFEFHGEPNGQAAPMRPTTPPPRSSPSRQSPKRIPPPPVWKHVDAALVRSILATRQEFDNIDPVALLNQIDRLHEGKANSSQLAERYQHLGNRYRERLEGDSPSQGCARVAIQLYRRAVQLWQLDPNAAERSLASLNEIGTLYWLLSKSQPREGMLRDLDASLTAYRQGLSLLDSQTQPQIWATLQHSIGSVYADLARVRQSPKEWKRSIAAFEAALCFHSPDTDPQQYAALQNNLGTAHWSLAQYEDAPTHLQAAIAAYAAALDYYSCDRDELNYAMLQNNLGTAYWTLSQQTRAPECLHLAVAAYREALRYRTPDRFPAGCAATQNNLGTAYWHLAQQQQSDPPTAKAYLEQSIAAYETAIEVSESLQSLTFDRLATFNNLGLALDRLAPLCDRSSALTLLQRAMDCHLQAFRGWRDRPSRAKTAVDAIARTVRLCYDLGGIEAQSRAFSQLPPALLSEVMQKSRFGGSSI
ncbi:hypothetical protein [Baaleninema sp.]|uniref:hypothetical protein n=1 Tax=Baaleninema sp. TaxID=3101197 RepID=UPI003D02972B